MMTLLLRRHWPGSVRHNADEDRASPERFRYKPLPRPEQGKTGDSFRLLRLLPGSDTDPMCCEIQTHCVGNAPPYEALSYCWGGITEKAQIRCDNCVFKVTTSVLKAPTHLRHSGKPRLLWIDQICIDQQNLQERSYQVSIMRLIYYNAVRTIVWLGAGDSKTEIAFDSVTRLAKIRAELEASGVTYSRISDPSDLLERYGLPSRVGRDEGLRALMNLLEQPWFERVWIIQEVAVSPSASVVQGKFETLWEDFAAAMLLTWELGMTVFASDHIINNLKNVHFIEALRAQLKEGKAAPLRYVLGLFRDAKATDPRDKVYALVGLSNAFRVAAVWTLSYEWSVSDTYRLWTIHILRTEKSLEILSAVNRYKTSSSTVTYSWVPDWSATDDNITHHAAAWPSARFQASACSEMDIKFRDKETVLVLTGHLLDQIEAVGLACSAPVMARIFGFAFLAQSYFLQQIWRSWEATARVGQRKTYRPTGESIWDAYWQTMLFGDHGYDQEKERVRAEFDAFYAAFRKPYSSAERWRLHWIRHLWAIYCVVVLILVGLGARGKYKRGSGLAFTKRCTQTGGRRLI